MLVPLLMIAVALALVLSVPFGSESRMRELRRQRDLRQEWRKQRGLPLNPKAKGEPPMPFHVRTTQDDTGIPYDGVSTRVADDFLAVIRRLFDSRSKRKSID